MSVREYKISDYPQIKEISELIWNGEDYLSNMINKYHEDPNSTPIVLDLNGKIVSVANIRIISKDIAWLEAMRTHPDYRSRGYARQVSKQLIAIAREKEMKHVMLSTDSENKGTAKILNDMGFEILLQLYLWSDNINLSDDIIDDDIYNIINKIHPILSLNELNKININYLAGEFKIYPVDGFAISKLVSQKNIYQIDNSVFTITKSIERNNLTILGYIGDRWDHLFAVYVYVKNQFPTDQIKIFYNISGSDNKYSKYFETGRVMNIMHKIL